MMAVPLADARSTSGGGAEFPAGAGTAEVAPPSAALVALGCGAGGVQAGVATPASDGSATGAARVRRRRRRLAVEPLQLRVRPFPLDEAERAFGERAPERLFGWIAAAMREQQLAIVEVGFATFIVVRRRRPRVGRREPAEHLADHRIGPVAARPGSGLDRELRATVEVRLSRAPRTATSRDRA